MLINIWSHSPKVFYGSLHRVPLTDICACVSLLFAPQPVRMVEEHRQLHIWYGHCCLCLCTTGLDVSAGVECDASTSLQSRMTDNSLPNDGPFQRTCLKHKTIHQSLGVYRSMLRSFIKIKPQRAGELVPWVRRLHIQACLSSEFEPSASMEDSWVWQCKGRTVAGA